MATQKQIDANRINALKSTGPRTATGKSKSRLNALRDGLTGQIVTLSPQDRPVFEQLKAEVLAGFNPQTIIERKLAHAIAWDTWRLDHLRAIEMNLYVMGHEEYANEQIASTDLTDPEALTEPDDLDTAFADVRTFQTEAPRLELMSLYEQRMTRNLHRNIGLLRDLQAERKRNYEHDKAEEVLIARIHEINDMPIQASTLPSKNGFIFSDREIAVAAVRQRHAAAAEWTLKNGPLNQVYRGMQMGLGEGFLEKVADKRSITLEEREAIYSIPPEVRATDRVDHPEAYGLRTP
jgi:hypothetical protein